MRDQLSSLWCLHQTHINQFVNSAGANEGCVQTVRKIGGHDQDAIGGVDNTIENVQQTGEVQCIWLLVSLVEAGFAVATTSDFG